MRLSLLCVVPAAVALRVVPSASGHAAGVTPPCNVTNTCILPIPKVIHFMWKDNRSKTEEHWPNLIWKSAFRRWQQHFPEGEYEYKWWTDEQLEEQFAAHCPEYLYWWKEVTFRNDLSRYCVLDQFGGIYSDLDYEPRINFYDAFQPGKINLLENWKLGNHLNQTSTYTNILMAAPPGRNGMGGNIYIHKFWQALLKLSSTREDAYLKHHLPPAYITGPWLFEHLENFTDANLRRKLPTLIHTLPCSKFYRIGWSMGWKNEAKPGCDGMNLTNVDEVNGIHWSTMSWFEPGLGDNRNVRNNGKPFHEYNNTFWVEEKKRIETAHPGDKFRGAKRVARRRYERIRNQDGNHDMADELEESSVMAKLFAEMHGRE